MKTPALPLRYTLFTLRADAFWLPAAFWALFAIMIALMRADPRAADYAAAYLGFALPLIAGILASSVILDNPALELHFATPRPAWRTLWERQSLILSINAVAAVTYQIYAAAIGVDLAQLGNPVARQLAWLTPMLALMALGCFGAFALRQSLGGMLLVGLVWIMQIIARDWFMYYAGARYFFVFMSAYRPAHPALFINQLLMLSLSTACFSAAWVLLKQQERYL